MKILPTKEALDRFIASIDMPHMEEARVQRSDALYICMDCGKRNDYYEHLCASCDAQLDTEEDG